MKKLRITVEGKTYDVEVEMLGEVGGAAPAPVASAASAPVASAAVSAAPAPAAAAKAGAGDVASPLSGVVKAINAQAGQAVKKGDKLITLEAMKMDTFVFAPSDGTVSKVLVTVGQSVSEGQGLVSLA